MRTLKLHGDAEHRSRRRKDPRRSGARAIALGVFVPLGVGVLMLCAPAWDRETITISNVAVSADGSIEPFVPVGTPAPAGGSIGAMTLSVERTYIGAPWAIAVHFVPSCQYVARAGSMAPPSEQLDRFAVVEIHKLIDSSGRGSSQQVDARALALFTDMSPRWVVWWPGIWRYLIRLVGAGVMLAAVSYLLDRIWWTFHVRNARTKARCPVCEYSLAGLNAPVCPECGHELAGPALK